jgi:N-acyl-D-aspartate/D-glutamate deacylase
MVIAPGFMDNHCHYDPQGVHVPGFWAEEDALFAPETAR